MGKRGREKKIPFALSLFTYFPAKIGRGKKSLIRRATLPVPRASVYYAISRIARRLVWREAFGNLRSKS